MSKTKYQVAPGCSILLRNGKKPVSRIVREGTILEEGELDAEALKSNLKTGHIRPLNVGSAPILGDGTTAVHNPGAEAPKPLQTGENDTRVNTHGRDSIRTVPSNPPKSQWVFDPEQLKGKSLEQLNALVAENDSDEQFETVEEARAFLSQDFEG